MKVESPVRVQHRYRQELAGKAEAVFELLCPVREADWVAGWDPLIVWTPSGLAERDCVFITPHESGRKAVWIYDEYDRESMRLGLIKVVPDSLLTRVQIQVGALDQDRSFAEISYTHTALSDQGRALLESLDAEQWNRFMQKWEQAMNHYLETGEKLEGAE